MLQVSKSFVEFYTPHNKIASPDFKPNEAIQITNYVLESYAVSFYSSPRNIRPRKCLPKRPCLFGPIPAFPRLICLC